MSQQKVIGVLAGGDMPPEILRPWLAWADIIFAADGGALHVLEAGFEPTAIIGDMDSLSRHHWPENIPIHEDPNQDTTDVDKVLLHAERAGHRRVTLLGTEGDLMDHTLSAFSSALRSSLDVRFALRRTMAYLVTEGQTLLVSTVPGRRVSLIPIGMAHGVDLSGVKWPLAGHDLKFGGLVSISNESTEHEVRAQVRAGVATLFIERSMEEIPDWHL